MKSIKIHGNISPKLIAVKGATEQEYQTYLGTLRTSAITRNPTIRGNTGAGVNSCMVQELRTKKHYEPKQPNEKKIVNAKF